MASSSRFCEVEEEKITEIIDAAIPENTKRQTTWSVSIFNGELSKTEFLQLVFSAALALFCKLNLLSKCVELCQKCLLLVVNVEGK